MKPRRLLVLLLLFNGSTIFSLPSLLATRDLGIILNSDSLLLDTESYQGGIGALLAGERYSYRLLADLYLSSVAKSRALSLGVSALYHFDQSRISPYTGATLLTAFAQSENGANASVRSFDLTTGAILGAMVYVTRRIALFAEYELTVKYSRTRTATGGGGGSTRSRDWTLDLLAGNESKIGVVLFLFQSRDMNLEPW